VIGNYVQKLVRQVQKVSTDRQTQTQTFLKIQRHFVIFKSKLINCSTEKPTGKIAGSQKLIQGYFCQKRLF
jgi:hypothetical protein